MNRMKWIFFTVIICSLFYYSVPAKVRIKELARVHGISKMPLTGYGLVVGLSGTGDSKRATFTTQSVVNMLQRFGINVPSSQMKIRNVAAVMITTEAPTFLAVGDRLDVTISSIGDAKSLEGGILLMSPIVDQKGELYGMAQGPVSVGGFSVETTGGGGVRQNHTLVGRIPNGLVLQRKMGNSFTFPDTLLLSLKENDFSTSQRIVETINTQFNDSIAVPRNPRTIGIAIPTAYRTTGEQNKFISELEQLEVEPDVAARVVINERTGTIVVGGNVRLLPAAIAHGNLSVEIESKPIVSQPAPFSKGQTVVLPNTQANVYTGEGKMATIKAAATVQEIAQALNTLGLSPRDVIAVMQALKEAGSLQGELVIM